MSDWLKVIHVARRQLNLSDDAYRAILEGSAGVSSSKEITTPGQFTALMLAFEKMGFKRQENPVKRPKNLPVTEENRGQFCTERQRYYIKGLWELASREKSEKSLRAIIKRIGHVEDIRFLTPKGASAVILTLRDITEKAGYRPDGPVGVQDGIDN